MLTCAHQLGKPYFSPVIFQVQYLQSSSKQTHTHVTSSIYGNDIFKSLKNTAQNQQNPSNPIEHSKPSHYNLKPSFLQTFKTFKHTLIFLIGW